jgi:Ca2+-binding EF-hand superfamily protein
MYIKIKIFEQKNTREFVKPFFTLEIDSKDAIKKAIIKLILKFFGSSKNDKVTKIINEALDNIENVLREE